jgi:hypothetical protein
MKREQAVKFLSQAVAVVETAQIHRLMSRYVASPGDDPAADQRTILQAILVKVEQLERHYRSRSRPAR